MGIDRIKKIVGDDPYRKAVLKAILEGRDSLQGVKLKGGISAHNCHESNSQGRWRERALEEIKTLSEESIRKQGAENVGFYSLTWSLYSDIYSLLLWNYERFGSSTLISQRADQASTDPKFMEFQAAQGELALTVGVEGVSQRMRNYLNKGLSEEQLTRTMENAAYAGYTNAKHFMILTGLETKEDIEEYSEYLKFLAERFKDISVERSKELGHTVSPMRVTPSFMLLLNLGHTPLQWGPCASSFDLEEETLRDLIATTKELGFGLRTSMTRERIRVNQISSQWGREGTKYLAEAGARVGYAYNGPVPKRLTYYLQTLLEVNGSDWMQYFREKGWNYVFPWDAVQTSMRRDYHWNQWRVFREYCGVNYCLRSQSNPNPRCLVEGTPITMGDGSIKSVEDVKVGDEVITHRGRPKKVVKTFLRKTKDRRVKVWLDSSLEDYLELTLDHPVMLCKTPKKYVGDGKYRRDDSLDSSDFPWLEVGEAEKGDAMFIPTPDFPSPTLILTPDELKLLGWYLAEGYPISNEGRNNIIRLSLNIDVVEDVLKDWDLTTIDPEVKISVLKGSGDKDRLVQINSKVIHDLVRLHIKDKPEKKAELGGKWRSRSKSLSAELFRYLIHNEEGAKTFFRSYSSGDGHWGFKDLDRTSVTISTSSRDLMSQLKMILASHAILCRVKKYRNNGGPKNREGSGVLWESSLKKSELKWFKEAPALVRSPYRVSTWKIRGSEAVEIKKIEVQELSEVTVYNFEVDEDESYLANGVVVHNCSDCSGCGTSADRKWMLTRELEGSDVLEGREVSKRDMTPRTTVRWALRLKDPLLRFAPKDILGRYLSRAFMLATSDKEYDNKWVKGFLKVAQTSMKELEGAASQPCIGGLILVDTHHNTIFGAEELEPYREGIERHLNSSYPQGEEGYEIVNISAGKNQIPFKEDVYGLYSLFMKGSQHDISVNMGRFAAEAEFKIKAKKSLNRDVFRSEEVVKIRSKTVPMAYWQPEIGGATVVLMCSLKTSPVQALMKMLKKTPAQLRSSNIECLGYYTLNEGEDSEEDIFAALEGRSTRCAVTGDLLETDVITGDLYRSKSGEGLGVAADLKGALKMRELGVNLNIKVVKKDE